MINFRRKIGRTITAILSVLILIVLALSVFLYFEAQNYLNRNLSELIAKKSKGKYELTFDNMELNFSHWGFEINQVSFHPSDSVTNLTGTLSASKQYYSFASPNIRFGGIRVLQLLFNGKLEIAEILIGQPELKIHGKKSGAEDQTDNIATVLQELRPLVTRGFKSITIGKIELSGASFDFYNLLGDTKKLAKAENITIGILNFYTDSILLPNADKLFDADDIYLKMQNYQNKLGDSIHSLNAGLVTYSLKRSYIEAQNVELKPVVEKIYSKGRYFISVPQMKLTSKRIHEFYKGNEIPIDSMILTDAKIKYWPGHKQLKPDDGVINELDLYELIKDEFSSVSIRDFKLQNAHLMLFETPEDKVNQQELKNISLGLHDFLLDSVSLKDTSRIFYAKKINFSASEYELTLGDDIHRMRAGYLNLSTSGKSILVKNIQLYPVQKGSSTDRQRNIIEASCDSVRLDGFDFKKAFHERRFAFQQINLFNPEVKITQNRVAEEKMAPENPSFIYYLISNYAKGIYADQVSVQKGIVQLVNRTGVLKTGNIQSAVKLQLSGFALDEVSARRTDRLFFANQIELAFNNYQMQLVDQLHKLTIQNLSISTPKKQAKLQNLHLSPVSGENMESLLKQYSRSELFEFTIPELALTNADFHEAFFNKKLAIDTLSIQTPQIYYENFALLKQAKPKVEFEDFFQLLSDYLDNLHIRVVNIPDGTIRLISHNRKGKTISLDNHFSLRMENTLINQEQFDRKRLLFSEFVDFSVRNHLIRLSDNVHVLRAGEVGFSTRRKEIFVTQARLYPETNSKDFSSIVWNIQLMIPEIRIRGINMEEFYYEQKINAEDLLISSPEIKLYQKRKRTETKELKEVAFPLPKEIESIAVRRFTLDDGSLKVFSEMGTKPYLLVQSDLQMLASNLLIKKDLIAGKPEFKSGEYTGKLLQFKFTPKDKNQQFSIDELSFSTADRQLVVSNLLLKPKTMNAKDDQFELRVPALSMNGFNMDDAYRKDQFYFESIDIDRPEFQLFNNERDSSNFDPFKVNLYVHFESFADVFAANSLNVNDADILVFRNGQKKLEQKVTLNLTKLRIDQKKTQGFMHAADFSFRIPNLKRREKLYQYSIGETFYSSANNRFVARDVRIIPNYDKENYQRQVGVQSDYFSGNIDSVCIEAPDIRRWFDRNELAGQYLSMNGLNLNIYRDKQQPFDENRRPKMLQDMIRTLRYPIRLDSLLLLNSVISYTEQPATGDPEGKIIFSDIRTRLKPFTNMKTAKGLIPDFTLTGTALVMDSCQLNVSMNYLMNHPENQFTVSGNLNRFNMSIFNPVLEPLAMVSLRSGVVDRFDFSFSADKTSATGELYFGYDNLKISVLEMKNGNTKEARFASFLANSLLLKSKNPRGKELLPEPINFQRDQKRSILNYWWKSVFSGVRNTLGIKENKPENQD